MDKEIQASYIVAMNNEFRQYIKDATAPVLIADAVALMGSKRRLAKLLGCANQTFTRFDQRAGEQGTLSPMLSMRWRAAVQWAQQHGRRRPIAEVLNALVDGA